MCYGKRKLEIRKQKYGEMKAAQNASQQLVSTFTQTRGKIACEAAALLTKIQAVQDDALDTNALSKGGKPIVYSTTALRSLHYAKEKAQEEDEFAEPAHKKTAFELGETYDLRRLPTLDGIRSNA